MDSIKITIYLPLNSLLKCKLSHLHSLSLLPSLLCENIIVLCFRLRMGCKLCPQERLIKNAPLLRNTQTSSEITGWAVHTSASDWEADVRIKRSKWILSAVSKFYFYLFLNVWHIYEFLLLMQLLTDLCDDGWQSFSRIMHD